MAALYDTEIFSGEFNVCGICSFEAYSQKLASVWYNYVQSSLYLCRVLIVIFSN
jgi:hypothetical protein